MATCRMTTAFCVLIAFLMVEITHSHSFTTDPQGISAVECRIGNNRNCAGPCDLRNLDHNPPLSHHYPPNKPAATWERGQKVTVKYARNNHGPGGFHRLTIVPLKDAMDKDAHARNAFYESCWGAHFVEAKGEELAVKDRLGFSIIADDGLNKSIPAGYYKVDITVPDVIPDGDYYLGALWYGGTNTLLTGNAPQMPHHKSLFGEYWSCSFIKIKGGAALGASYTPKFVNDYSQFSEKGCMSSAGQPGEVVEEPSYNIPSDFRIPNRFQNGDPAPITPANFGGVPPEQPPSTKPTPPETGCSEKALMSCACIAGSSSGCFSVLAADTNSCTAYSSSQSGECVSSCCALCKETGDKYAACKDARTRDVCSKN